MVEFQELTGIENKHFDAAMDIYLKAFPANERQPENVIRERVRKGLNQIYTGRTGSEIVFMALLWPLKDTDFILLDYMAISAGYRGKNIGSLFLQKMHQVLEEKGKYFILEVEHPEYGENREERQRRVAFYRRNGAKELKDTRYILPPLQGTTPTEMKLMIFPDYHSGKMDTALVKKLIIQIYKELYDREANDTFLNSLFTDAKAQVDLV